MLLIDCELNDASRLGLARVGAPARMKTARHGRCEVADGLAPELT
jgi:hypothetical protein